MQHTLYAMGQGVLDTLREVTAIRLTMPNKHHLPVDLSRFGLENRNEIFVATEEPHGLIEATVARVAGGRGGCCRACRGVRRYGGRRRSEDIAT